MDSSFHHGIFRRAAGILYWIGLIGLFSTAAIASPPTPQIPETLTLYAGQAVVRDAPGPLKRVAVGNGSLVEVRVLDHNQMVIIANKPGDTSLQLWMRNGQQRNISLHIVTGNTDQVADLVRRLLDHNPAIAVNTVGGNVVLTGTNLTQEDLTQIAAIKKVYPQVLDFTQANAVQMKPMVMMKVRIMEFDKNAMNKIGIQWGSVLDGPGGGLAHDWSGNSQFRMTPSTFGGIDGTGQTVKLPLALSGTPAYFGLVTSITSKINLMMQTGNAWELATPQLAARSGGVADFLVGGEVPIPVTQGLGQTSVEYKPYGIKLHIEPVVSSDGNITTSVKAEISHIDPSVTVQGYPGFLTRKASTEVNVHEGQTIVISGLVDSSGSKALDEVPGLGQIPVLGELFRSHNFQAKRTDLVIFVTPYIVTPHSPRNQNLIDKSNHLRDDFQKAMGDNIIN
ncbi:type II and III secretion system protein [Halothiobacillus diazotrophicus]|uniref:Type II and III secretion system protein n=1 Tax=Halothiobacillus diazotrophicus TaxID=1860122 RepID=A0A191ZGN0_9GAMM|nr:pilus assembly protein N-terminal domain-containing protein [Halothiobacillus diazotrophicus]ANJ67012.1 type II and III secretion system protein [Halothiobacillus diazotrophicus]